MDDIKNILNTVIGDLTQQRQGKDQEIFDFWSRLLNKKEIRHQKLIGVKDRKMFVHVDSSVWLYEFKLRHELLVKEVKKIVPDIEKIIFKIGPVK